ncbi:MAG: universal stress protein, partial [Treponema sp.]|nr:universal stress protein [Treponema sp.]
MMKNLLERVVIAHNGSQSSFNAVLYGILLSKQFKLSLKVVYVGDSAAMTMLTLNKFMVSAEGENIRQRLLQ